MLLARKGQSLAYNAEIGAMVLTDLDVIAENAQHYNDDQPAEWLVRNRIADEYSLSNAHFADSLSTEREHSINAETDFSDYNVSADDWNEREFTNAVVFDPETGSAIDLDKTPRYHAHLLNVFRDKTGVLRCGSISITHAPSIFVNDEGVTVSDPNNRVITARCVKCKVASTVDTRTACYNDVDYDREWMITWTRWVIQHGHNHAAQWARKYIIG